MTAKSMESPRMKKIYLIVITVIALTLAACSQNATAEVIPTISLDSSPSQPSSPSSSGGNASASGVVVPVRKVELAFPTLGAVKTVEVVAGDQVIANQPLVTLDPSILRSEERRVGKGCAY